MQERDLKILSFLTMCRICTRKQVQELLFPDVHENIPLRRLKKLTDEGYINRKMFNVEGTKNMYVYYLDKQPKKKLITHTNITWNRFIVYKKKWEKKILKLFFPRLNRQMKFYMNLLLVPSEKKFRDRSCI